MKSAGLGLLGLVVFALIAILVIPSVGITILILPGAALAPVIGPLFEPLAPFVASDGGPEFGVSLLVVGGILLWWIVFSVIAFAFTDEHVT